MIYHEIVQTSKGDYMRDVIAVEAEWLAEIAPHFYEFKSLPGATSASGATPKPPKTDNTTHSYFSEPMNIF